MAEIIGVASGIADLITITAQIVKISCTLVTDFKNAPQAQETLLLEVLSLKDVLTQVQKLCNDAGAVLLGASRATGLSASTIAQCREQLLSLQHDLQSGTSRILWMLKEKQFQKRSEALRRFRDMFASWTSVNTLNVATRTYRKVEAISAEDDRRKLLNWLSKHEDTSRSPPQHSPGTGGWLLEAQEYREWRQSPNGALLSCTGAPGIGKSALAAIVIQDLIAQSEAVPETVAFYFCDFAVAEQQDAASVMQSLLRQIIPSIDSRIIHALVKLQARAKQADDLRILSQMLVSITEGPEILRIVFDAPDELLNPTPVLSLLEQLVSKGSKVFLTSRPLSVDYATFLSKGAQLSIIARHDDIVRYVHDRLKDSDMYNSTNHFSVLAENVANKANGIFLLAQIFVDELLQMTTIKKMRKALETMPMHLEDAYETSLTRIESQPADRRDLARKVIMWVTHARRRLSSEEMQHALALEEDDADIDEDNIPNLSLLVKICAGIVSIGDDGKLGMVHATAYEYFKQRFHDGSDETISKTLMNYLRLNRFSSGACNDVLALEDRMSQAPLLSYAASHWSEHIRAAQVELHKLGDILAIVTNDTLRSTALQAAQYKHKFVDRDIAGEYLKSVPTRQGEVHAVAYWDFPKVLDIICLTESDLNQQDSQGWTPLHWACHKGSTAAIHSLVQAGADINIQDSVGWTPLFWCAFNGDVVDTNHLLLRGADYLVKDSYGWTPLAWATVSGSSDRLSVINVLLEHYDRNTQGFDSMEGNAPLDLAEARGDCDLFKTLLPHREKLPTKLDSLWSSGNFDPPIANLWRAAYKGEAMFGINYSVGRTTRLLIRAIKDEKRTVMRALLELGAPVNGVKAGQARSPLHWATFRKDTAYVCDLLDAGADVTLVDSYGQTALLQAVINGSIELVKILLQVGSNVNTPRTHASDSYPSFVGGHTPLMAAYGLDHAGSRDHNLVNGRSRPRTFHTIPAGRGAAATEMASLLLSHGADPHAVDELGQDVMRYAILSNRVECVQQLLAAGATFERVAIDGTTALHDAVKAEDIEILGLVVDSNPDYDVLDKGDKNVFHHLGMRPREFVLSEDQMVFYIDRLLEKCHADLLNAGCPKNWGCSSATHGKHVRENATPLSLAFESRNWPLAKVMDDKGAILPDGFPTKTWLQPAVNLHDIVGVRLLLRMGIKPRKIRWTLFRGVPDRIEDVEACCEIITELLDAGLDINQSMNKRDQLVDHPQETLSKHSTLISLAASARADDASFGQLLLDRGADPRLQLEGGTDAFLIAAINGNWNTLATMLRWLNADPQNSSHWAYRPVESEAVDDVTSLCHGLKKHGKLDDPVSHHPVLYTALMQRNDRLASALLDVGANPNYASQENGLSLLHYAAFEGQLENVSKLIQAGARVNSTMTKWHNSNRKPTMIYTCDPWQGTPLHLAAMMGYLDIVKVLVASSADVKAITEAGNVPGHGPTALHLALSTGQFYCQVNPDLCEDRLLIAELLIAEGADVSGVGDHLTNLDARHFKGHEELWERLRAASNNELRIEEPEQHSLEL